MAAKFLGHFGFPQMLYRTRYGRLRWPAVVAAPVVAHEAIDATFSCEVDWLIVHPEGLAEVEEHDAVFNQEHVAQEVVAVRNAELGHGLEGLLEHIPQAVQVQGANAAAVERDAADV